jgi:hypothetical protein
VKFTRKPQPVEYAARHRRLRAGDIGANPHEIEMEPMTAPSIPEPLSAPEPVAVPEQEPVPA